MEPEGTINLTREEAGVMLYILDGWCADPTDDDDLEIIEGVCDRLEDFLNALDEDWDGMDPTAALV
jgi:hypothetical protein